MSAQSQTRADTPGEASPAGEGMQDPYESLVALAEVELGLVREGAFEALLAVQEERAALVATLPAVAPAEARGALERAALLQATASGLLGEEIGRAREVLGALDRGRGAINRYAPALTRRSRIDCAG